MKTKKCIHILYRYPNKFIYKYIYKNILIYIYQYIYTYIYIRVSKNLHIYIYIYIYISKDNTSRYFYEHNVFVLDFLGRINIRTTCSNLFAGYINFRTDRSKALCGGYAGEKFKTSCSKP